MVAVLDALESAAVPYMIVGSLASNFHGIPRSTRDADFVVEVPPGNLGHVSDALPQGLNLQRQGAFEAVTGTTVPDRVGRQPIRVRTVRPQR